MGRRIGLIEDNQPKTIEIKKTEVKKEETKKEEVKETKKSK